MALKSSLFISLLLAIAFPAVSQSLTVSSIHGLDFGDQIFPGIEKSISYKGANAAQFQISGEGGREVQVTFQLPDYLADNSNNDLAITFSSTDAGYNTIGSGQSIATVFDPNTGIVTTLGTDGNLYIWLGGTIKPISSQTGNVYNGDIILDVTYTN